MYVFIERRVFILLALTYVVMIDKKSNGSITIVYGLLSKHISLAT